jgi:hypothetical protein
MNWKLLFGHRWVDHSFGTLVNRKIRERRGEELRFAEQRITKHRLQAIKSCVADARSYRVARDLPILAHARFD